MILQGQRGSWIDKKKLEATVGKEAILKGQFYFRQSEATASCSRFCLLKRAENCMIYLMYYYLFLFVRKFSGFLFQELQYYSTIMHGKGGICYSTSASKILRALLSFNRWHAERGLSAKYSYSHVTSYSHEKHLRPDNLAWPNNCNTWWWLSLFRFIHSAPLADTSKGKVSKERDSDPQKVKLEQNY